MKNILGISVALVLALGACSNAEEPNSQPQSEGESKGGLPDVDWSAHMSSQKKIIDKAARKGACELLQDTFDVQADREPADPEILDYIDAQLRAADCY